MGIDNLVNKLPGSIKAKAAFLSFAVVGILSIPVFNKTKEQRKQGHEYFSQEKPEQVAAGQEANRRRMREEEQGKK
jgi:hypothetical protein